jgi:diaminopimelate epimerase
MRIEFYKYHGTGNDFIMLDNRNGQYSGLSISQIQFLCDRRTGIGADGLICIDSHANYAFEVDYSNSDGSKSFCGNGARCSVAFAESLGIPCDSVTFLAIDGEHQAHSKGDKIAVQMGNVTEIREIGDDYEVFTGSPHYIRFAHDLAHKDIVALGREIRYSETYREKGINVNLAAPHADGLAVQTYERGVEDETLSCGTGVTAVALAHAYREELNGHREINVHVKGGLLTVAFNQQNGHEFTDVWLSGPAVFVFKGEVHA